MEINRFPRGLSSAEQQPHHQNEGKILTEIQSVETQAVIEWCGTRKKILVWKDQIAVQENPKEGYERSIQDGSVWLAIGVSPVWEGGYRCGQHCGMEKQQRVIDRVRRHLHMPTEFIVKLKALVRRPQAEASGKQRPEQTTSCSVLDSVADR